MMYFTVFYNGYERTKQLQIRLNFRTRTEF